MRINLPVTGREYELRDGAVLVSKTDPKGRITYVNDEFVEVSGYSIDELMGKAHNLVRHPDMPPEAFSDLWTTLHAGRPWTGFVKNRRKNGDHYWVLANVTPIRVGAQVTEYMSVRSKPTRAQVEACETAYREFREGRAAGKAIVDGKVVSTRFRWLRPRHQSLPFALQATAAALLLALPAWAVLALAKLAGTVSMPVFAGVTAATAGGAALLGLCVARYARTLRESAEKVSALTQGDFDRVFPTDGDDELAALQRALQSLRTKVGFELIDSQRRAAEATRLRQALDRASTNVVVADKHGDVIYLNDSAQVTFARAETEIRAALPAFQAAALRGARLESLATDPVREQARLQALTSAEGDERHYGGCVFRTVVSPVVDERGQRIGTVMEWTDRTQETLVEREVESIVAAAVRGDLSRRVKVEGKQGFYAELARGLNAVLDGSAHALEAVQRIVDAAAAGDLTQRMQVEGRTGFHRDLGVGLNTILESMATLLRTVQNAAEQVHRGAAEISHGNMDLSQRTEEQASSLEETAASMEQMTSTVKQNADHAHSARKLAADARTDADKGSAEIGRAIEAMHRIRDASQKIVSILDVIDGIALQTNLLALNAAVEAARAGEQGRGFAVVATEVRNLALRSADAAREIKPLIDETVRSVEHGSQLVDASGHSLAGLQKAVARVSEIVAEIASASNEQAAGIEQVNKAITTMDAVTQQNAALVEEAAAAAESLSGQADDLRATLARYRFAAETAPAPRDVAVRAA